jgi:hypothetical protein
MNNLNISRRAMRHISTPEPRRSMMRFGLSLVCIVAVGSFVAGCGSVQGTKSDYFGYRNNIPAPAPAVEQEVSQQAWTNPMQSGMASSVAFVPVITPWYDGWSMFARPSARFWGAYDGFGGISPWGAGFGGYGYSGWGGNPWACNSFYDPFWGYGSSFMFYSSPWQRFNPYFGAYTPFGFYRPLGYWSSQNFTSYNNNLNNGGVGGGTNDVYTPSRMRDAGVQRAYGNNASAYTGTGSYNNSTYIGSYNTNGASGGAFMRGQGTGAEYKQNNPNNRASQNSTYRVGGNAASNYSNYYSGSTAKSNNYTGSESARYYPTAPSSTMGGRSSGGYSSGYSGSTSFDRSSSSGSWGGKSSGGYSSGGYSSGGSSSGGSSGGNTSSSSSGGGGARSRGGQ